MRRGEKGFVNQWLVMRPNGPEKWARSGGEAKGKKK